MRRLENVVRDIERLGLRSEMEAEIFRQLLRGRRTISELTELILGSRPSSSEFHSSYMKIWRAVRELEAKGLVSAPLLGKEKAYRLTRNGLGVLLRISEDRTRTYHGAISRWDIVLLASTILSGMMTTQNPLAVTSTIFVFILGATTCKILIRLREVW